MEVIVTSKIKDKRLKSILLIIIGLISYYYFYSTLVTTYLYYLIILVVAIFIALLYTRYKIQSKSKLFYYILKLSLIIYFFFFSCLFILKNKTEVVSFNTPLNGYYTRRIDGVLFQFQNRNFDRKLNLNDYPSIDLKENYDVKLELQEVISGVYYIHDISLEKKWTK